MTMHDLGTHMNGLVLDIVNGQIDTSGQNSHVDPRKRSKPGPELQESADDDNGAEFVQNEISVIPIETQSNGINFLRMQQQMDLVGDRNLTTWT